MNNQEGLQGEESLQDKKGSETADEDWDYYICWKRYSNKRKGHTIKQADAEGACRGTHMGPSIKQLGVALEAPVHPSIQQLGVTRGGTHSTLDSRMRCGG